MSKPASHGPEKKITLDEAAEKIATEFPNIFTCENERHGLKGDFKLLPNYENAVKRRFAEIASYDRVKKYEAKAKAAGRPTLLELAKQDAAGRTEKEVTNTDEVLKKLQENPELARQALDMVFGKLIKDLQGR